MKTNKTHNLKWVALIISLLVNISISYSQNVEHLTLEKCLEYGLQNNYKVEKSNLDQVETNFATKEAKSKLQPQVSVIGQYDNYMKLVTSIMPGEFFGQPGTLIPVRFGTTYQYTTRATLNQVIFDPTVFNGIKVARNAEELSVIKNIMSKEQAIYDISMVYYDLLKSGEELEKVQILLMHKDSIIEITEHKVELGTINEIELNRLKVDRNILEVSEKNLKSIVSQQLNYLRILVGIPLEQPVSIDKEPLTFISVPPSFLKDSLNFDSISDIQLLEIQKQQLLFQKQGYKRQYLPTLSANATGAYQYQSDNLHFGTENTWSNYAYIGLTLNIPVYDGLAKQNKIRQTDMQISRIDLDIENSKQTAYSNYINAYNQLQTNYLSIQSLEANVKLAQTVYTQTNTLYINGKTTLSELLSTESALREAQFTYVSEIIKYKKTQLELQKIEGSLLSLTE